VVRKKRENLILTKQASKGGGSGVGRRTGSRGNQGTRGRQSNVRVTIRIQNRGIAVPCRKKDVGRKGAFTGQKEGGKKFCLRRQTERTKG